jgi:hypothetical protein
MSYVCLLYFQFTLVGKSLLPAHQKCLSPANSNSLATLMPVVMPYPWRIALFAGDNSTYCWRIATFARGNMLPLANVAMRQHVTPGECCNALGIIILCASKNNYSSRKINFIQQIIHRITAAKQGIIFTSDQDSNITNKSPILHTSAQDSNIHKLHKVLIRTYTHNRQVAKQVAPLLDPDLQVLFGRVHKLAKQGTHRKERQWRR